MSICANIKPNEVILRFVAIVVYRVVYCIIIHKLTLFAVIWGNFTCILPYIVSQLCTSESNKKIIMSYEHAFRNTSKTSGTVLIRENHYLKSYIGGFEERYELLLNQKLQY